MRDQEQRARVAAQPVLEPQHGVEVEVVRRLVEQQQVRAAHQRLREVEAHAPAAGEARHRLRLLRLREAEAGEQRRRARARAVAADRPRSDDAARRACAPSATARPRARARCRAARDRRRARSRSPASPTAGVSCATCASVQRGGRSTSPASGVQLAANQREQARLAGAVGADQARPCAGRARSATRCRAVAWCRAPASRFGDAQHA